MLSCILAACFSKNFLMQLIIPRNLCKPSFLPGNTTRDGQKHCDLSVHCAILTFFPSQVSCFNIVNLNSSWFNFSSAVPAHSKTAQASSYVLFQIIMSVYADSYSIVVVLFLFWWFCFLFCGVVPGLWWWVPYTFPPQVFFLVLFFIQYHVHSARPLSTLHKLLFGWCDFLCLANSNVYSRG